MSEVFQLNYATTAVFVKPVRWLRVPVYLVVLLATMDASAKWYTWNANDYHGVRPSIRGQMSRRDLMATAYDLHQRDVIRPAHWAMLATTAALTIVLAVDRRLHRFEARPFRVLLILAWTGLAVIWLVPVHHHQWFSCWSPL